MQDFVNQFILCNQQLLKAFVAGHDLFFKLLLLFFRQLTQQVLFH